jgi:DnaK suppressor protein
MATSCGWRHRKGWQEPSSKADRLVARTGTTGSLPAPSDDIDLAAVRRALEERRDRTRERLAALAQRPELGTAQGFGKRIGDGTIEAISRLTEIGVGGSLEQALARTERALAKLDDGTYGSCDTCGESIAPARLHAMPDGVMCLACASSRRRTGSPRRR